VFTFALLSTCQCYFRKAAARRGKLPEAAPGPLVTVVLCEQEADAMFDYICSVAAIDRPG
jgi:hypothetical protein